MLACSPCLILIVANLPRLNRQSPLSEVPIQSVPSASAWSASTKSLLSSSEDYGGFTICMRVLYRSRDSYHQWQEDSGGAVFCRCVGHTAETLRGVSTI